MDWRGFAVTGAVLAVTQLAFYLTSAALPLYLRDLVFLGHIDPESPLKGVENGGLYAIAVYTVVLLLGVAVLVRRYRWTER